MAKVFVSYCHQDEKLRERLVKHLQTLIRLKFIEIWHDREISAGTEWAGSITAELEAADIILLLISADFIASEYCYSKEMLRAMERHESKAARVIPVILKDCDWHLAPFGKLQAVPREALAITLWQDQDAALADVARQIRKVVDELAQRRTAVTPQVVAVPEKIVPASAKVFSPPPAKPTPPPQRQLQVTPERSITLLEQPGGGWLANEPLAGWRNPGLLREDQYGLYAQFSVKGITQRCRWIPTGSFLMGSPPDEPERSDNEIQHHVTLSGYWLADTACTQALWQTVMGKNSSRFNDNPTNPVENISWDDAREFFGRLNQLVPGLAAGWPSEAQWEYACRAGTITPFSFGKNITAQQVNYDGTVPYANGSKGEWLQKTVPVASLPANPWGLYEMHGNVWEWCSDWFGDYETTPQRDPEGAQADGSRVLRGGSWYSIGRDARSAYRNDNVPGLRSYFIGLRVAPGRAGLAEPAASRK